MAINLREAPTPQAVGGTYSKEAIESRKKWAQRMLENATEYRLAYSPWQALAQALQGGVAGYFSHRANEDEKSAKAAANAQFNDFAFGVKPVGSSEAETAPEAPDVTPKGPDAPKPFDKTVTERPFEAPAAPVPFDGLDSAPTTANFQAAGFRPETKPLSFTDANKVPESGGRNIPNLAGTSSAFGPHQITETTWRGVMNKYPQLQLTMDDHRRPEKQDLVMREALEPEYRATLAENGFDPNEWRNMRAMHFLNPKSATKLLTAAKASPNAPAARFVKQSEVAANKSVFFHKNGRPKTVAEVSEWLDKDNPNKAPAQPYDDGAPDLFPSQDAGTETDQKTQVADNSDQLKKAYAILGNEYATDAQRAIASAIIQKAIIPKDPIQVGDGEAIWDPNTGKLIFENKKDSVTDNRSNAEKLYDRYVQQETEAGREPKSIEQFTMDYARARNPANLDPELVARTEDAKEEIKNWTKWGQTAANSSAIMQMGPLVREALELAPQGPLIGRAAEMFPGFSNAGVFLDSQFKEMAPKLRVEGSGSTSDIEYEGMLNAYPRLRNNPIANKLIWEVVQKKAEINVKVGATIDMWRNGQITQEQARAKILEIRSQPIISPQLRAMLGEGSAPGTFDSWARGDEAGVPNGGAVGTKAPPKELPATIYIGGKKHTLRDGAYYPAE